MPRIRVAVTQRGGDQYVSPELRRYLRRVRTGAVDRAVHLAQRPIQEAAAAHDWRWRMAAYSLMQDVLGRLPPPPLDDPCAGGSE